MEVLVASHLAWKTWLEIRVLRRIKGRPARALRRSHVYTAETCSFGACPPPRAFKLSHTGFIALALCQSEAAGQPERKFCVM